MLDQRKITTLYDNDEPILFGSLDISDDENTIPKFTTYHVQLNDINMSATLSRYIFVILIALFLSYMICDFSKKRNNLSYSDSMYPNLISAQRVYSVEMNEVYYVRPI